MKHPVILLSLAIMVSNVLGKEDFEGSQLPLSTQLSRTFPKTNCSCFIVVNEESNLILHEKYSNRPINTGTFDHYVFKYAMEDLSKLKQSNFVQEKSPFSGRSRSTLCDMCKVFFRIPERALEKISRSSRACFFKSTMSGFGCAFRYQKQGCSFRVVMYGASSRKEVISDILFISEWLDQFFVFNASKTSDISVKIPVIYGLKKSIPFSDKSEHRLVLSRNCSKRIKKTQRYRTIIKAPISPGDELGVIFYETDVFYNPIIKMVKTKETIEKANYLKCILDSFRYLIFGATLSHEKGNMD